MDAIPDTPRPRRGRPMLPPGQRREMRAETRLNAAERARVDKLVDRLGGCEATALRGLLLLECDRQGITEVPAA